MTVMTPDDLADYLVSTLDALRGFDPEAVAVTPIEDEYGGPLYCLVELDEEGEALMVRLPPDRTIEGLSGDPTGPRRPAEEAHNLALVAPLGLTPASVQFDPDTGLWAYPLWSGVPINMALGHDPEAIERIGRAYRLLHGSRLTFQGHSAPFDTMDLDTAWTRATARDLSVRHLAVIQHLVKQCQSVLQPDRTALAPCINAAAPEACFDTGTRIVFLDWRASAMSDPHFELARLSERAGFNAEQVTLLLSAYSGSDHETARDRVLVYRLVAAYGRLLDQSRDMDAGRAEADPEVAAHRLKARLDACQMILDSASWKGAMERLRDSGPTGGAPPAEGSPQAPEQPAPRRRIRVRPK